MYPRASNTESAMATKSSQKFASTTDLTFMKSVSGYFYEPGIGKKRVLILCKQLKKFGGSVSELFDECVTHIVMSRTGKVEKLLKHLKVDEVGDSVDIVDADWLSACFLACEICDVSPYLMVKKSPTCSSIAEIKTDDNLEKQEANITRNQKEGELSKELNQLEHKLRGSPSKRNSPLKSHRKRPYSGMDCDAGNESSYSESDGESAASVSPFTEKVSPSKPKGVWICTKPSTSAGENLNEHITEKLEVLAKAYTNTQDRWRALGYQKAISSIKNYPKRIETVEEVKTLPFVGDRLAKKIAEILETGHLRRLDHMDPNLDIINAFNAVWGAGPKTAETWLAQGYRSLEDLRTKADVTYQQKIGLKFYDEFLQKISREEVKEIEKHVAETACELIPGMEVVTCGSFRRGRKSCGDVDILISHPDGRSHRGFLMKIIDALQQKGRITDDLITVDDEEHRKYMGVFKLPGEGRLHRRLDVIVAPYSEWACALVHFTGSGRLNRSMRQLAKTKGMSLSEHALRDGVVRKGQDKVHKGVVVPVFCEEDIFHHLGLDYLQPHERDW